jgi:ABC-type lipoprotein export system ATPase subunit
VVDGRGLSRLYSDVAALDGVDLAVHTGRITVIAGPSGSGKSTLLRLVACLDRPTVGTLRVAGNDVLQLRPRGRRELRRRAIGLVHAEPARNLLADLDARHNIVAAAQLRRVAVDADGALAAVGLGGRGSARVTDLSGGEQLRLAMAIASIGSPAVVVADEPTASLDASGAGDIVAVVSALARRGSTFVIASHDPADAECAHEVVALRHGRVVA